MGGPDFMDSEIVFLIGEIHFIVLCEYMERGNSLTPQQTSGINGHSSCLSEQVWSHKNKLPIFFLTAYRLNAISFKIIKNVTNN